MILILVDFEPVKFYGSGWTFRFSFTRSQVEWVGPLPPYHFSRLDSYQSAKQWAHGDSSAVSDQQRWRTRWAFCKPSKSNRSLALILQNPMLIVHLGNISADSLRSKICPLFLWNLLHNSYLWRLQKRMNVLDNCVSFSLFLVMWLGISRIMVIVTILVCNAFSYRGILPPNRAPYKRNIRGTVGRTLEWVITMAGRRSLGRIMNFWELEIEIN